MAYSPAKARTLADLGGDLILKQPILKQPIGDSRRVGDTTAMPTQIPQSIRQKLFPLNPISAHHRG